MPMNVEIGAIVIGHTQYESIPRELRQVLAETAAQYTTLMVRNVRRDDDGTIPQMAARGTAIDTLGPAERSQWEAIFARTRTRLAGQIGDANWFERIRAAAR